jgi:hypothetical protein
LRRQRRVRHLKNQPDPFIEPKGRAHSRMLTQMRHYAATQGRDGATRVATATIETHA